jgi:hypothetical protein
MLIFINFFKKDQKMTQQVSAEIWLPYFKQGDDLEGVKVVVDGKVNTKMTLLNHIALLEDAIAQLQKIHDLLPNDNTVDLHGDCHYICITGEKSLIETLEKNNLVKIEEFNTDEDVDEVNTDEDVDEVNTGEDVDEVPPYSSTGNPEVR